MPNRMLRDWTASDKINSISVHAERFFVRLIMKVDDYGCFYADIRLLKANLYPLLLDTIREADMLRWMDECHKAGLIVLYEVSGKKYLQIFEFRQRLDRARSKFPLPTANDPRVIVNDFPPEVEVETEAEVEPEPEKKESNTPTFDLSGSNLYRKPKVPNFEDVYLVFTQKGGNKEMASKFYESNESTGWYYKGSPITNFSNLVSGYIESWKKRDKSFSQPESDYLQDLNAKRLAFKGKTDQ